MVSIQRHTAAPNNKFRDFNCEKLFSDSVCGLKEKRICLSFIIKCLAENYRLQCCGDVLHCSALGAVALGGKLFICGGYDGVTSLNSVEVYDLNVDQWTMVSSMEKHRSAAGLVVLDAKIYAIGGHDGLSIFDSVSEVFIYCA